jgi:hypothetical protein
MKTDLLRPLQPLRIAESKSSPRSRGLRVSVTEFRRRGEVGLCEGSELSGNASPEGTASHLGIETGMSRFGFR